MKLRIFTEPQQGATYDSCSRWRRPPRNSGSTRSSDPTTTCAMGRRPGLPGSTDAWITLAGLARETVHDPARHPGDPGDVPAAGPARDQRGPGRPDERRPGRARPRRRLVRREHTAYGIPFPSLGERFGRFEEQFDDRHRALGHAPARRSPSTGRTTGSRTRPRCPSRPSGRTRRSSSAASAPGARPGWPRGTPTSTTCRSVRSTAPASAFGRVGEACQATGRDRRRCRSAQTVCFGSDEAELARRAAAIGTDLAGCARTAWPARPPRWWRRSAGSPSSAPSGSTSRCWTWRTSTTWS